MDPLTDTDEKLCKQDKDLFPGHKFVHNLNHNTNLRKQNDDSVPSDAQIISDGSYKAQLEYWKNNLNDLPEMLNLPTDYPRSVIKHPAGAAQAFYFSAQLTRQLEDLAIEQECTLYVVLLGVINVLLYRYTMQSDICIGSPIAGRRYAETDTVTLFSNTLALRNYINGDETFIALLSQVKNTYSKAYANRDTPFEKIIQEMKAQHHPSMHPFFQVMTYLRTQNTEMNQQFTNYAFENKVGFLDLIINFCQQNGAIEGEVIYSTALYKPSRIARLVDHISEICHSVVARPNNMIGRLTYLSRAESLRVTETFNDTHVAYPQTECLHHLFLRQAAISPDSVALICGNGSLTYQQLQEKSQALACYLKSRGAKPDQIIGVCIERSCEMIVAILGILISGAAYLPLDPAYPRDRLAYMLKDCQAQIVLTEQKLRASVSQFMRADTHLIELDRQWEEIVQLAARMGIQHDKSDVAVNPRNLAYIIYTSGSTGQPKGVAIEHHSPVSLVYWASEIYGTDELSGVLGSTSICFDLSVFEIFVTLANGGKLILLSNALALHDLVSKNSVTLINTAPSVMEQLLRMGTLPQSVQTVNLAGEALSPALVDKIYEISRVTKVYDLYGPSEDTTYSTYSLRKKHSPATIGKPITNTRAYILDSHHREQAIGIPGELYLSGDGLARGYLHRQELTEERFVANPFVLDARMYKTGDLARWSEDGNLQYLGRVDTQVKIHGLRIELEEIEARLNQHPVVDQSVVIAKGQGGEKVLVAFYRTKKSEIYYNSGTDDRSLRSFCLTTLPSYMLPSVFVKLDSIPLNQSGKVNRNELANIDISFASNQKYVGPRNETEKRITIIWEQLFERDESSVGVNDSFFELGGHSLLATRLIANLSSEFNVVISMTTLFEHNTISELAKQIVNSERQVTPNEHRIDRAGATKFPLTFAQEGLWFLNEMEPGSARYNLPMALTIKGHLMLEQVEYALDILVGRHESLRTTFSSYEGQTYQAILPKLNILLDQVDLRSRDNVAAHREVINISKIAAVRAFDFSKGPLIRGILFKIKDDESVLSLFMHHIICDGWSTAILGNELQLVLDAIRDGYEYALPILRTQFADYSLWERDRFDDGVVLKQQLAYWIKKLSGLPESLNLIADYARQPVQSLAGASQRFVIEAFVVAKLSRIAHQKSCTLYMLLLTIFNVLLHRYSSSNDICIGMPIANRHYPGSADLIGMFVNTLALRNQVEADDTFFALLSRVKQSCLEAYEHQETPFEKIVALLRPHRNRAMTPIFQVMCTFHNTVSGCWNERMSPYLLDSSISKFDLSLEFRESGGCLSGSLEYSTSLYRSETALRMCEHFVGLCRSIVEAPRSKIYALEYMSAVERSDVLLLGSGLVSSYRSDVSVGDVFTDRVLRQGSSLALVFGEERLSYGELYGRSVDLALYLQSLGVGSDSVVGLFLERSVDLVVGILGVELAGGAYLPLDPSYPDDRLEYMLSDSGALVVLSQSHLSSRLGVLLEEEVRHLRLDGDWEVVREGAAELRCRGVSLVREAGPETLSYVIYTSGSTGRPKGVEVEHRALMNRLQWMQKRYGLEVGEVVLQKTPYSFDVSVWEFFWPLLEGATLVLAAPEGHKDVIYLESLIAREGVTTLHFVPPMLRVYLETARGQSGSVRRVFCSGESLDVRSVEQYRSRFPNAELHNLYGPTEAAIDVTSFACSTLQGEVVPIGRPIDNIQMHVLDAWGHLQPVGVPGELYIAGDGLARGYRNNPILTAEKFVANPFCVGTRMYRTGDLARWLEDGNLQYLGRIDTQVKLRGFRIELGEIEACLNQYAGVEDSVVMLRERGEERDLVAFYRTKPTDAGQVAWLDMEALKGHVGQHLPEYMIPTGYVSLAEIPLTASGKADRRALAKIEVKLKSRQVYVSPNTETEFALAEIWSELLQLKAEDVGTTDSFFSVGGNSLLAVRLMARITKRFGKSLPVANIFTAPTIASLSRLILANQAPSVSVLVPIQSEGDALPIFAIPGVGGNVLSLQPLSTIFGPNQPFYGLEAVGLDGRSSPLGTVEETATVNIKAMKALQPQGPYHLLGHSYGGVVAYEMARILIDQSEQVASLVLLDSISPFLIQDQVAVQDAHMLFESFAAAAGFYDIQLPFDKDHLNKLSETEAINDMVGLLNSYGVEMTVAHFTTFFQISRANVLSYQTYKPLGLRKAIDATLYRATKSRSLLPADLGWGKLLCGQLRVYDIHEDHFSILRTNILQHRIEIFSDIGMRS